MQRVALITGSSRGIGRNIANKLASMNYNIVLAAKSTKQGILPGTIYSVKREIREKYNVRTLAIPLDLRYTDQIENCVQKIDQHFGRLDILINNAGALWWNNIENTSEKQYDLINNINSKASFYLSKLCLPLMERNNYGHIIMHSPPLTYINDMNIYINKTAYMISKYGMTMTALGIASEYKEKNIAANTIWPSTAIESEAVKRNKLGNKKLWRKPDIISDAIANIISEDPLLFTGNQLIDDQYLRSKGITDLSKYRCVPNFEPPKLDMLFKMK